jgi:hypothetical protein
MAAMATHREIKLLLANRIRQGDYQVRPFPSPYRLAEELDVDRRTASKAMQSLVEEGLLVKSETGRIAPASREEGNRLHLAMLAPAFGTPTIEGRFAIIQRLVERRGWSIRFVGFGHGDDPAIYETIDGVDLLFLAAAGELPEEVITRVRSRRAKVVSLLEDLTAYGIPSLPFDDFASVNQLLDHLHGEGHRSVACLNTQRHGRTVRGRIEHWQLWKATHQVSGELIDEPVNGPGSAMLHAREVTRQWLRDGRLDASAIFVTTGFAAIGVMRGLADEGLRPGVDIAVCAADAHGQVAECLVPSLTAALNAPEEPYFQMCLDWFASKETAWPGPLLVQPGAGRIFVGESTSLYADKLQRSAGNDRKGRAHV